MIACRACFDTSPAPWRANPIQESSRHPLVTATPFTQGARHRQPWLFRLIAPLQQALSSFRWTCKRAWPTLRCCLIEQWFMASSPSAGYGTAVVKLPSEI